MADILLDSDIRITNNGDINIIYLSDEVLQSAINNLQLKFGELQNRPDIGNKIFNSRMKLSNDSIPEIILHCTEALLIDSRIRSINYIDVTIGTACNIDFEIVTSEGLVVKNTDSIIIEL